MNDEIKKWKFKMSFTHFAFLRNLILSITDDMSCKKNVKRDRRLISASKMNTQAKIRKQHLKFSTFYLFIYFY
jgi:hypothetical protein